MARSLITYAPEGAEPRQWEFDSEHLLSSEAELIESVGGDVWMSYPEWLLYLSSGNMRADRALIWMLLRRDNPDLEFDALDYHRGAASARLIPEPPVGKDEPGDFVIDSPPLT